MAGPGDTYVALDFGSALLLLLVASSMGWAAYRTRRGTPALLAAGLALVALSYPTVAASHLDLGRQPDAWDHLRLAGQTGGSLAVLFAYLSARRTGAARATRIVGWTAAALTLLYAALYLAIPPAFVLPPVAQDFAVAHGVMALAYAGAALVSLREGRSRLLVPIAWSAMAMGKALWVLVDLGAQGAPLLLIYAFRMGSIVALLLATMPLWAHRPGGAHAQA